MKKNAKEKIYNFIKGGGVTAIIALIVVVFVFIYANAKGDQDIEIMDWTILTSIVVAMALEISSKAISRVLLNKLEDDVKLTTDYDSLSKKYINQQVKYDNSHAAQENIDCYKSLKGENDVKLESVTIPVVCDAKLYNMNIRIDDSAYNNEQDYELPNDIQDRFDEIFAAHATSTIYNQVCIRINDWYVEGDDFVVKTSRTTYFKSMVTNRAMDFRWQNGVTVREMYECGPYLNSLKKSVLSNHIGFNGFVESRDGYVVFIRRKNDLSIGKRTYGNSLGAALKAKYALDCSGKFTEAGLINGILKEIEDELKLNCDNLENVSLNSIVAAYRDLVEGGKPQFLVVVKSNMDKNMIEENFFAKSKEKGISITDEVLEDGDKLLWIKKEDLRKMCILPDSIIHKGVAYSMMPSAVASIVMYLDYLERGK